MSNLAQAWAWTQDIPLSTKGVLLALADHADDEGVCWPGVKGLAQKCRLTPVSIRYHLRVLRKLGLLFTEERHREDGTQTSNLYHLPVNILTGTLKLVDRYPKADDRGTLKVVNTHEPPLEPSNETRRRVLAVSSEFRARMKTRFGSVLDHIDERIDEALNHKASEKWKKPEIGVQSWLRRDAEKNGRTPPPQDDPNKWSDFAREIEARKAAWNDAENN